MFLVGVDVRYKIILKQMKAELMLLDSKNKLKWQNLEQYKDKFGRITWPFMIYRKFVEIHGVIIIQSDGLSSFEISCSLAF